MGPGSTVIYHSTRKAGSYRPYKGTIVNVTIETELRQEAWGVELSIMGDETTTRGRCWAAGQNRDALTSITDYAPGWNRAKVKRLAGVWDRWHLNGMHAGCEHQRALGWTSCPGHYGAPGKTCSNPNPEPLTRDDLDRANDDLRRDGVALVGSHSYYRCSEDKISQPCPECGYKYGTAWLRETLPDDVITFVKSL